MRHAVFGVSQCELHRLPILCGDGVASRERAQDEQMPARHGRERAVARDLVGTPGIAAKAVAVEIGAGPGQAQAGKKFPVVEITKALVERPGVARCG